MPFEPSVYRKASYTQTQGSSLISGLTIFLEVAREDLQQPFDQLSLPLADLIRVDAELRGQIRNRPIAQPLLSVPVKRSVPFTEY
jgi:hypothetical protein